MGNIGKSFAIAAALVGTESWNRHSLIQLSHSHSRIAKNTAMADRTKI